MIKNNIFKNDDGTPMDIENRDMLLIEYGTILERMRHNARECAKGYEDYLRMSWGIEAQVSFNFDESEKDLTHMILNPKFSISFGSAKDEEIYKKLINQKEHLRKNKKKTVLKKNDD